MFAKNKFSAIYVTVCFGKKCVCDSLYGLHYGRKRSPVIHNSFASYDGDVIFNSRTNKPECQ